MSTHRRLRHRPATFFVSAALLAVASTAVGGSARAATAPPGSTLTQRALSGQTDCQLTAGQFAQIGEDFMTRMLSSSRAEDAMRLHMRALWGDGAQRQAYQFMGERLAGCSTGDGPAAFGTMMGLMGAGMMGASLGYGTAGYTTSAYRPEFMMGGSRFSAGMMDSGSTTHSSGLSAGAIVAIALGFLALLGLILVLLARRPRSTAPAPPPPQHQSGPQPPQTHRA
jgi:hypothetical protein